MSIDLGAVILVLAFGAALYGNSPTMADLA
jgi:hypothetical protein